MKGGLLEHNELACLSMLLLLLLLLCLSGRGGDLLLPHRCKVLWISSRQWTLKLASSHGGLHDGRGEMICEQVQLALDGAVRSTTTAAGGRGALLLLLPHEVLLLLLSLVLQHLLLLLKLLLLLLLLMLHHPMARLRLLLLNMPVLLCRECRGRRIPSLAMRATGNRGSRTLEWKQR